MTKYIIISTPDHAVTLNTMYVTAKSYTTAYLEASLKLPEGEQILRVYEVTK